MTIRITVIQGHPNPEGGHFGHVLADAYRQAAREAGHTVKVIDVARLDFPLLRTRIDWEKGEPVKDIKMAQEDIARADHLVLFYPLWLGTMPALLKGFLEQVLRPGFAIGKSGKGIMWEKKLKNKSARVIVTMGMPAFVYRWIFRAHSLKSLERNILKFCGINPVRETLIGMVEQADDKQRRRFLEKMKTLGRRAI